MRSLPASARPRLALGLLAALALFGVLRARPGALGPQRAHAEEPPGTARVDSVKDVRLPTLDGKHLALSDLRDVPVLVLAWTAPGCPVAEVLAPRLLATAQAYEARGVRLLAVCSDAGTPIERLRAHVEKHDWGFPLLVDGRGLLAQRVGAKTTTTVVLLDKHRRVRYRGALDDQYGVTGRKQKPTSNYLSDALDAVLGQRAVAVVETSAPGCPISFAAPGEETAAPSPSARSPDAAVPTWSDGAGEVLQRRCGTCHREGEAGPFPLLSYGDAAGRSAVLREVLAEGRMPPWGAAGPPGMFANDRRLTEGERATLLAWLAGGAPEGDPARAPVAPAPPGQDGWEIGTPDAVLSFPTPQAVPAEGVVPYRYVEVPTDFPEDRWVVASEVRPGAPQVMHHALVQVVPAGRKARRGSFEPHLGFFAAMVPGGRGLVYPAGMAKRLPKGARLYFQVHYTPNGVAVEDVTRIGLRFSATPPTHVVETVGVYPLRLEIPPGAANHEVQAAFPIPFDARVLAYMPHMHLRGKSVRYETYDLKHKDAAPQVLLDVPNFDFNWQTPYRLAEPRFVAGGPGKMLRVVAVFDNSYGNPYNPDPNATVHWGDQTWDEMLIGYLDYVRAEPQASAPVQDHPPGR